MTDSDRPVSPAYADLERHVPEEEVAMRDGTPGFRLLFRVGPVHLCRIGSWDTPRYPSFGAWVSGRGLSLRYRGYVLRVN